MRRNHAAAAFDKLPNLRALRVRERDDVRENERFKLIHVRGIQKSFMHQLERNSRLDQRLIPAVQMVFSPIADKPRRLLRINNAHARERALVAKIFFPAGVPDKNFLNRFQPALVTQHRAEFDEPRAHSVRDQIGRP